MLTELPGDLLAGAVAVHRADLQGVLAEAAGEVGLGVEVTSVEQEGDGVVARAADGAEYRGDLLIGADGAELASSVTRSPRRPPATPATRPGAECRGWSSSRGA